MNTPISCIIAATLVATAIPAHAEVNANGIRQITIQHDDLNLLSKSGMDALQKRLRSAAEDVCGVDEFNGGSRIRTRQSRDCFARAMLAAKRDMAKARERQAMLANAGVRVATN